MSEGVTELDDERLTWMYRQMLRIRDSRSGQARYRARCRGHTHLADDLIVPVLAPGAPPPLSLCWHQASIYP